MKRRTTVLRIADLAVVAGFLGVSCISLALTADAPPPVLALVDAEYDGGQLGDFFEPSADDGRISVTAATGLEDPERSERRTRTHGLLTFDRETATATYNEITNSMFERCLSGPVSDCPQLAATQVTSGPAGFVAEFVWLLDEEPFRERDVVWSPDGLAWEPLQPTYDYPDLTTIVSAPEGILEVTPEGLVRLDEPGETIPLTWTATYGGAAVASASTLAVLANDTLHVRRNNVWSQSAAPEIDSAVGEFFQLIVTGDTIYLIPRHDDFLGDRDTNGPLVVAWICRPDTDCEAVELPEVINKNLRSRRIVSVSDDHVALQIEVTAPNPGGADAGPSDATRFFVHLSAEGAQLTTVDAPRPMYFDGKAHAAVLRENFWHQRSPDSGAKLSEIVLVPTRPFDEFAGVELE